VNRLRVGYACLARLSFDGEYARGLFEQSLQTLAALDLELVHLGKLTVTEQDALTLAEHFAKEGVDAALIQYGTFSLGSLIPIIAQQVQAPLVLWGVPEPSLSCGRLRSNSLCAVNMNAHTLMRLGRSYDFIFCNPKEAVPELERICRVLYCIKRLRRVRLGLVGYRVPGFYTSTCDELEMRKQLGVEIHHVTLAEVYEEAREIDQTSREQEAARIRAEACSSEVNEDELDKAAALYLGFKAVVARHGLDALAVKCWPEFPDSYGIAACSTLGRLNGEGILSSCEGDVYGAVTMLIEHYLTGATPMFADFVAIDENENTGIAWHCGAAPACLAANDAKVKLCKHSTVNGGGKKGITADFPIRDAGPVTMTRLGVGPNGLRLFFAGGQAVKTDTILPGNTLEVRFACPVRCLLEIILKEGVEHHYALVHADIRPELRALAKWLDVETIDVDARQDSKKGEASELQTNMARATGI
jgi:L-fucose isomerase-like protein